MSSILLVISVHTIHQMSSPPPLPFDATAVAAIAAADVRSDYVCEVFAAKGSGVVCWNNKRE